MLGYFLRLHNCGYEPAIAGIVCCTVAFVVKWLNQFDSWPSGVYPSQILTDSPESEFSARECICCIDNRTVIFCIILVKRIGKTRSAITLVTWQPIPISRWRNSFQAKTIMSQLVHYLQTHHYHKYINIAMQKWRSTEITASYLPLIDLYGSLYIQTLRKLPSLLVKN